MLNLALVPVWCGLHINDGGISASNQPPASEAAACMLGWFTDKEGQIRISTWTGQLRRPRKHGKIRPESSRQEAFPTAAHASGKRSQVTGSTLGERSCGGPVGNSQKSAINSLKKWPRAVSSHGPISVAEDPPCFGLHVRVIQIWMSHYVRSLMNQPKTMMWWWVWNKTKKHVERPMRTRANNPLKEIQHHWGHRIHLLFSVWSHQRGLLSLWSFQRTLRRAERVPSALIDTPSVSLQSIRHCLPTAIAQ